MTTTAIVYSLSSEGFKIRDALISLQDMPLAVLRILERQSGKIVRMHEICAALRNAGPRYKGTEHNVHNAISTLRRKLRTYGASEWIHTIKNTGYRFMPPERPPVARVPESIAVSPVRLLSHPVTTGTIVRMAEPRTEAEEQKPVDPRQFSRPGPGSGKPQSAKGRKKWMRRRRQAQQQPLQRAAE